MSQRKEKVTQQIKEIVSQILHDKIRDPRIGFITITKVEISNDLQFARIFFSILGTAEQKQQAKEGLESAKKYIRHLLGENLKIRYTPEICFKLDESAEYSIRIEQIFERIENEKLIKSVKDNNEFTAGTQAQSKNENKTKTARKNVKKTNPKKNKKQ